MDPYLVHELPASKSFVNHNKLLNLWMQSNDPTPDFSEKSGSWGWEMWECAFLTSTTRDFISVHM